ncbi:MAG: VOC family protein [Dehalococcoidia bacterium]|nr:VOC family protein [Dehalococcoidia bacterium]
MPNLQHIDHVAITVSDLARSEEWYRTVLGLERRFEMWDEPLMLGAGDTCLALFADETKGDRADAPHLLHVAFRVDREGFQRAQDEFRARGVDFRFSDHGLAHSVYIKDPDGNRIEITTYELD